MNFVLVRTEFRPDGVFGVLTDSDGSVVAHTLEHAYDDGQGGWAPKITQGQHTCVRGTHALHNGVPFETFEITGVPGHSGLLFHIGNINADSEGCVLVGTAEANGMITASRVAFAKFMQLLDGVNQFTLLVVNPPEAEEPKENK